MGIGSGLTLASSRCRSPEGVRNPRDSIDCEGLCGKQDHRDLDHGKFSWLGDDPERHDECSCACGRVTHSEQRHKSTGSRKRKSRSQNSWKMHFPMRSEGLAEAGCDLEGSVAANQPDGVTQDGVARAGRLGQGREEEQVRGGTNRRKDEWATCNKSKQAEQPNRDEAVDADIHGPDEARRQMLEKPSHPQMPKQRGDMFKVGVPFVTDFMLTGH